MFSVENVANISPTRPQPNQVHNDDPFQDPANGTPFGNNSVMSSESSDDECQYSSRYWALNLTLVIFKKH